MKDYGIILLSHSNMCCGLYDTATMVFGTLEKVKAIPFVQNQDLEEYKAQVMSALDELGHDSIILLDLYGGTPFNTVLRIVKDFKVNAICGMNFPMLIQALECRMQDYEIDDAISKIVEMAKEGVVDMAPKIQVLRKAVE